MKTRPPLPQFDAPDAVMRLAGAWLARRDRGFTAVEADEFERWVRAHPSHAAGVAQLERTMSAFDRVRELVPLANAKPDFDAFAPARAPRRWLAFASVGMAAALTIVIWSGRPPAATPTTWHFATPAGSYHRAALVDGSRVELNSDSIVDVEFTSSERRVRLKRGEAHFQVAEDSSRPFVVHANTVSVSAVGTAFNVRLATTGVEVLVTEGKVRIAPPSAPTGSLRPAASESSAEIPLLTAGHKVLVSTAGPAGPSKIAVVSPKEIQHALAWQSRVAEFQKTPLKVVVAEFNRHNSQQIVIQDVELETLRIGGNFRTDQPEAFVRLLETSFGVAVERSGDVITLRKAVAQ